MESIEGREPNGDRAPPVGRLALKLPRSGGPLFASEAILKKRRGIGQKIVT